MRNCGSPCTKICARGSTALGHSNRHISICCCITSARKNANKTHILKCDAAMEAMYGFLCCALVLEHYKGAALVLASHTIADNNDIYNASKWSK
jgi:hypothetical protein